MKSIAENIRNLREVKGYTLEYVAENVGVSVSILSRLETTPEKMRLGYFIRLANFYEIKLRKIFSNLEDEVKEEFDKLSLHIDLPTNMGSEQLYSLAKKVEMIENKKYGSNNIRK